MNMKPLGKSSPMLIVRLAIMMFLQFFVWGAWYVSMYGFLADNGMTEKSAGGFSYDTAAYTLSSIAAILAPLTIGLIVDRLIGTEKMLGILFLIGGVLLWIAPSLASGGAPSNGFTQFLHPMVLCILVFFLCFMPTLGLTASLSFKHLANGEKEFPIVRVLGTIGWIVGNWAMWGCRLFTGEAGKLSEAQKALKTATEADDTAGIEAANTLMEAIKFSDNSPHMFHVAAIASVILGIYSFTLPKTDPPGKGQNISIGKVLGMDAWAMLKDRAFMFFALASFLICIPLAGYYKMGYGYVDGQGITLFGSATGAMSTGQMSEIFFMLLMPLAFARLGVKNMLLIGMSAWALRYGLWGFAFGQEGVLMTFPIFVGLLLHGICYDFFFVTGMIYTDKKARPEIRGQAQSLVVMLTQGLGLGLGTQLFGWWGAQNTSGGEMVDGLKVPEVVDFATYWYGPAIFAVAVMIFFAIVFWDRSVDEKLDDEPTDPDYGKDA